MQQQYLPFCHFPVDGQWNNVGTLQIKTKAPRLLFYFEMQLVNPNDVFVRGIVQAKVNTAEVAVAMGQDIAPNDNYNVTRTCLYQPGFIPGEIVIQLHAAGKPLGPGEDGLRLTVHKTKIILLSEV